MFKTLSQVEPRIPLESLPTNITVSGSYYLTTNLTGVSGTNGITITVDNVTIDLNGFALIGVAGSSNGVFATANLNNIAVRNGTLRNWTRFGADVRNALNSQLLDLRVSNNGGGGLHGGTAATILRCVATLNTTYGLYSFNGSVTKDSTAFSNNGDGITTTFGSTIADCSANGNTGAGFVAGAGGNVRGCSANANTGVGISSAGRCQIESCNASDNTQQGIWPNDGSSIRNCTVGNNAGGGIRVGNYCLVLGNICHGNSVFSTNAAIRITGLGNRIEGNHLSSNHRGFEISSAGNLLIRNSTAANSVVDSIAAGQTSGPTVTSANIGTSTNPHANYDF
jgi:parallel beta-helix repeat protein